MPSKTSAYRSSFLFCRRSGRDVHHPRTFHAVAPTVHPKILSVKEAGDDDFDPERIQALIRAAQQTRSSREIRRKSVELLLEYSGTLDTDEFSLVDDARIAAVGDFAPVRAVTARAPRAGVSSDTTEIIRCGLHL